MKSILNLLSLWNSNRGPLYQIRESDLIWNFTQQNLVEYKCIELAGTPCILATASNEGVKNGLSADNLWLALWGPVPGYQASSFVKALLEISGKLGKKKVFFGADEFHFLPGIPMELESDQSLLKEAISLGFETSEVADFTGPLSLTPVEKFISEARDLAQQNQLCLIPVESTHEHAKLNNFLLSEFPGRWHREYLFWKNRQDTQRSWWMNLYQKNEEHIGFARLSHRERSNQIDAWTPASLRMPIEENNSWNKSDGSLGPIGVAKNQRGKGSGKVLLGLVLQALRQNSVDRICIDWTNAFKYYEPLGFNRSRNFFSSWRTEKK